MNHYKFVLPEHLNHYGSLFGGNLLKWIDEVAFITARVELPDNLFVTVSIDAVEFRHRVESGDILRFDVQLVHRGNTSARFRVQVFGTGSKQADQLVLFETTVSFVNIDQNGNKQPIV